ncbi:hypothetical protein BRIZO_127 [Vibrio phage Brizo]|uniref:Uncharacterized protein n=1 Tax=Vibrio phage Brizo TaxID=2590896 RepID=A0A4Y6E7V7_9CAUD|nr:hypothetical protein KNU58_gp158 [Vibrio phage Brizo]QDF14525.1 hypothetical protein BRIZO_127 [Vibrio phage Brizo]
MFTLGVLWLIFQWITCIALADCKSEDMCNKIMWMPTVLRWIIFTVPSLIVWATK